MSIEYKVNVPITVDQFSDILDRSSLGERRPLDDRTCLQGMLDNSNLVVTAWEADRLLGIARSLTDFHYACYLADLAVCRSRQKSGIGRELQRVTRERLGPRCRIILLAAPAASRYYERIGYAHDPRCWVLPRDAEIRD